MVAIKARDPFFFFFFFFFFLVTASCERGWRVLEKRKLNESLGREAFQTQLLAGMMDGFGWREVFCTVSSTYAWVYLRHALFLPRPRSRDLPCWKSSFRAHILYPRLTGCHFDILPGTACLCLHFLRANGNMTNSAAGQSMRGGVFVGFLVKGFLRIESPSNGVLLGQTLGGREWLYCRVEKGASFIDIHSDTYLIKWFSRKPLVKPRGGQPSWCRRVWQVRI